MKKNIIISGINLRSGGTLSIYKECLNFLNNSKLTKEYNIIALVHKKELFNFPNIKFIEFPKGIKSYLYRLYYEYFYFKKISKKLNPYLWLSIHDMTPNVYAEKRVVYMHNASMFYKVKLKDFKFDKTYILFSLFYKYIYKINLKKNDYLIVQQNWIKREFSKIFNIPKSKIIVSYPELNLKDKTIKSCSENKFIGDQTQLNLFYPSLPRPFKNFEIICEAAKSLYDKGYKDINFYLTLNGTENKYANYIYENYKNIKNIHFLGLIPKEKMEDWYQTMDSLIFPSKLETWGLPISEFKPYEKPMLLADLPYAKESAIGAHKVAFFNPDKKEELESIILDLYNKNFVKFKPNNITFEEKNFISFEELFDFILEK